jgi:hypothetical protein
MTPGKLTERLQLREPDAGIQQASAIKAATTACAGENWLLVQPPMVS